MKKAGCHVVYGFVGMKTHAKLMLIVREEADGWLQRYCHIGTGNYHPATARLYEDFGLLTADRAVGEDITDLFNHLTGYSRKIGYRRLIVAPEGLRAGIVGRVGRRRPGQGGQAREDPVQVQRARRRGCGGRAVPGRAGRRARSPVDTRDVRGQARVPGLSDTSGCAASWAGSSSTRGSTRSAPASPDPEAGNKVWIGSPDMMHRNLDRRVEGAGGSTRGIAPNCVS